MPSKMASGYAGAILLSMMVLFGIVTANDGQAAPKGNRGNGDRVSAEFLHDGPKVMRLREVMDIHERHKIDLMALPGVVASGTSLAPDGEPYIKVFTDRPDTPEVPDTLESVSIRKQVGNRFYALRGSTCDASGDQVCEARERWPLPVPIGVSVGNPAVSAGTIGARVTDGINVFILSNNHVLAANNPANIGDNILQPGKADGGVDPDDAIATLADFDPVVPCTRVGSQLECEPNPIDAAVAVSTPAELGVSTPQGEFGSNSGYGTPRSTLHPAYGDPELLGDEELVQLLGVAVQKYGRTTGLTTGTIDTVNASVNVCQDSACATVAMFTDQLIVTAAAPFSAGGDSGSLVVDNQRRPVGLLFAGSSQLTAINRIDLVLDRFGVWIDDRDSNGIGAGRTPNSVTNQWYSVGLQEGYAEAPVILASIETFDGGDTVGLRLRNIGPTGFEVKIEEEQSYDSEMGHTSEVVGYLTAGAGSITDSSGSVIGEAGLISISQGSGGQWRTITLQGNYATPVVLMNMTSYNGGQPSHIRLRNVTSTSFQYQIEEWDYLDQSHTTEDIGYVVLESGIHALSAGSQVEVGLVETDHQWKNIVLSGGFSSTPIMLSQCQTYYGGQAVVTRQRNGTNSGFQVRLQEEEGNDGGHLLEMIGYVAVGP